MSLGEGKLQQWAEWLINERRRTGKVTATVAEEGGERVYPEVAVWEEEIQKKSQAWIWWWLESQRQILSQGGAGGKGAERTGFKGDAGKLLW